MYNNGEKPIEKTIKVNFYSLSSEKFLQLWFKFLSCYNFSNSTFTILNWIKYRILKRKRKKRKKRRRKRYISIFFTLKRWERSKLIPPLIYCNLNDSCSLDFGLPDLVHWFRDRDASSFRASLNVPISRSTRY